VPLHSILFAQPPRWIQNRAGSRQHLPANVQSWVYESGSLTQRLRTYYGRHFGVKILLQCWHKPFVDECRLLNIAPAQYTLIREVLLHSDNTPLILARSIMPQATINVAHRNLSHLGTRPLGEVIFAYPNLQRLALEFTQVPAIHWHKAIQHAYTLQRPVWGRRTVYAIPVQPLLVSEFFMPACLHLL
jgi:chorismate lyase